jgi:DNA-binding CsgD family transcriptional regulator
MTMAELIALATVRSGKSKGEIARELGYQHQTKISRLANGEVRPNASEIVYLAEIANLPPLETLAEFESAANPHLAQAWKQALKATVHGAKKL